MKDTRLYIRISSELKNKVRKDAKKSGKSVSDYITDMIQGAGVGTPIRELEGMVVTDKPVEKPEFKTYFKEKKFN